MMMDFLTRWIFAPQWRLIILALASWIIGFCVGRMIGWARNRRDVWDLLDNLDDEALDKVYARVLEEQVGEVERAMRKLSAIVAGRRKAKGNE